MRDIFLARLVSVLLLVAALVGSLLLMTCTFPLASSGRWQQVPGLTYFIAHLAACALGAFFVVFVAMALQGILLNLLPGQWFDRLSLAAQIVFLVALLAAIPATFSLPNAYREVADHAWWLPYVPASWFFGLYERCLGNPDPYWIWLSHIGLRAAAGAVAIALATYLLSLRRYAARSASLVTGTNRPRLPAHLTNAFSRALFPTEAQQAIVGFVVATLRRSRHHKLLLSLYVGIGVAFAINSAGAFLVIRHGTLRHFERQLTTQSVLAVPFILSLLLACGLAHAFRVPSEPRANWIFRMIDPSCRHDHLAPAGKLILGAALLPVLVTPFFTAFALGWRAAWLHTAFAAALALLIAEFSISGWNRIPFTCSYLAGRKPFFMTAARTVLIFIFLTTILTGIESVLLATRYGVFVAIAVMLAIYAGKVRFRRSLWRDNALVFDDAPDEMFTTLAILPR